MGNSEVLGALEGCWEMREEDMFGPIELLICSSFHLYTNNPVGLLQESSGSAKESVHPIEGFWEPHAKPLLSDAWAQRSAKPPPFRRPNAFIASSGRIPAMTSGRHSCRRGAHTERPGGTTPAPSGTVQKAHQAPFCRGKAK